ncbi:hypothetical protein B0H17DRAFT_1180544 [Mycena rosella]|uniref:Uncharacterized protein n=1 Tax=Mycena rosella TaxID=1033263 RepID=A0AAD7GCR9_MYCRO|nr:hypothetical protein B0H17DRAFT_1180544 [Mycena rosella]
MFTSEPTGPEPRLQKKTGRPSRRWVARPNPASAQAEPTTKSTGYESSSPSECAESEIQAAAGKTGRHPDAEPRAGNKMTGTRYKQGMICLILPAKFKKIVKALTGHNDADRN